MDERNYDRFVVDTEVTCFVGERHYEVFLYDLSAGGCMIEARDAPLEGGATIHLKLNDFIEASGQVAWQAKGNAGVRFDQLLHEAAVKYLGFSSKHLPFDDMKPRDRFGQLLPPLQ